MNSSQEGTVLRESRVVTVRQKIKIIGAFVLVLLIAVLGWYWIKNSQNQPLAQNELAGELPLDLTLKGFLYFEGFLPEIGMNSFALNLESGTIEEVTSTGNNWGFAEIDQSHALVSQGQEGGSIDDETQIAVMDFASDTYLNLPTPKGYYKQDMHYFQSNNTDALVYSARTKPVAGNESYFDPTAWEIVMGVPETQTFTSIPASFSPVYVADRNEIVFVNSDSVSAYNLITKEPYAIDTTFSNFDADTEVALSPDRTKMILTVPSVNSIFVFDIVSDSTEEKLMVALKGVIKVNGRYFSNPSISPDGRFYATYAFNENAESPDPLIEIRTFDNKEVITAYPVEAIDYKSIKLNAWIPFLISDTAKSHAHEGLSESHQ
ncbi:MAG: hypothetical protein V4606_04055 [Patescibacteria group bacterium]